MATSLGDKWDEAKARAFEDEQASERKAGRDEVTRWREDELIAYKFPPSLAKELAADRSIDLEWMRRLRKNGCPPEVVAVIVR